MKIENNVILGDCLEILPKILDDIFDLIVIDPPNLILAKHYSTRTYFKRSFGDLGLIEHFYKEFFKEFERVIKLTGLFYIFCNESSYPFFWYYTYPFTKKIRLLTWDKLTSINGYHWRHQTEIILFGIMPNAPPIKTGDGDILECKSISKKKIGYCPTCHEEIEFEQKENGDNDRIKCRAVPVKKRKHPAQKPLKLINRLILKSSKENDLIADFFAGSGTTLLSAKNNNRKYFGIEYDNGYFKIIERNLMNIKSQSSLKQLLKK